MRSAVTDSPSSKVTLDRVLALCGLIFFALFVRTALARLNYPFEFDLIEGGMFEQVRHVASGLPLYAHPSIDFIPFIYGPLFTYFSAGLATSFGLSFELLRLVSILATFGTCLGLFALVRGETGNFKLGIAAAGLFTACYPLTAFSFDQGRVDSVFLMLLVWATVALRTGTRAGAIGAAALFTLAFFTKQVALIAVVLFLPYLVARARFLLVPFLGAFIAFTASVLLFLESHFAGWYRYYCFFLPGHHDILPVMYKEYWSTDLFAAVPVSVGFFALYFFRGKERAEFLFCLCFVLAMLLISWISRLHAGGVENVLAPAYAGLAFGAMLALKAAPARLQRFAAAAVALQFVLLTYTPSAAIPSSQEREQNVSVLERIDRTEGEAFIPYHPYLLSLAGKKSHAHQWAIFDVLRGDREGLGPELRAALSKAFETRGFSVVISDDEWFKEDLERSYALSEEISRVTSKAGTVRRGAESQPRFIYVPKVP